MIVVRVVAAAVMIACLARTVAGAPFDGGSLLGIIALAVLLATFGVFTVSFWVHPDRLPDVPGALDNMQQYGHPEGRR